MKTKVRQMVSKVLFNRLTLHKFVEKMNFFVPLYLCCFEVNRVFYHKRKMLN